MASRSKKKGGEEKTGGTAPKARSHRVPNVVRNTKVNLLDRHIQWLEGQAQERGCSRSQVLRDLIDRLMNCAWDTP